MAKLFITPKHGKLGATLNALKDAQFNAQLVGYGYPPMFIEENNDSRFDEAKKLVESIDDEVEFSRYRADLMDRAEVRSILGTFTDPELDELLFNIDKRDIDPEDLENFPRNKKLSEIVTTMDRIEKLDVLVEKMHETAKHRF